MRLSEKKVQKLMMPVSIFKFSNEKIADSDHIEHKK